MSDARLLPPALVDQLSPRLTEYIPHSPSPKQTAFLLLPHREALYGGAAGGGKSDALLMAALQWVDTPKYAAIIFRKTMADAELPGAIYDRAKSWLMPWVQSKEVNLSKGTFTFPSGATLTFSYLKNYNDHYRYQGAEFQFIAFDEVTQFADHQYLYLKSRLRRSRCPHHAGRIVDGESSPLPDDPKCRGCQEFAPLARVPLRMRAACNPGGIGHLWVKKRFDIRPGSTSHPTNPDQRVPLTWPDGKPLFKGHVAKRPYIPARLVDNPFLSHKEYGEELSDLDPITRERLLNGDWSVTEDGRFKPSWVRNYSILNADILTLAPTPGKGTPYYLDARNAPSRSTRKIVQKFQIIDPAASTVATPGQTDSFRAGVEASWTVIGTFLLTDDNHLIIWDWRRARLEADEIYKLVRQQYRFHRPLFVGMEHTAMSTHLFQLFERAGLPMKAFYTKSQDKIQRSIPAQIRYSQGRVWTPSLLNAPWVEDFESEIFTWIGHPYQTDDQVDVLSYACQYVADEAAGSPTEDALEIADLLDPFGLINDDTPDVV